MRQKHRYRLMMHYTNPLKCDGSSVMQQLSDNDAFGA